MLDFVDQCEEMAAAYGCHPRLILEMPWVHLRIWMEAFNKRQRREFKVQAALRNAEIAQNMGVMAGGMLGGAPPQKKLDIDLDDERAFDALLTGGFPVKVR